MDNRILKDIHGLSTVDLVECMIALTRELRAATALRDEIAGREVMWRMNLVAEELGTRQLTIYDL